MMLRGRAEVRSLSTRQALGPVCSVLVLLACAAVIVIAPPDHVGTLSIVLGIGAAIAGVLIGNVPGGTTMVSSSFIVFALAAAFLGPASGALAAAIAEIGSTIRLRTNPRTAFLL